jgi:CDGSH iron-sulfur domain-containing protein 3
MEIKFIKNGPAEITGEFRLIDADGKEMKTENTIYLCRCGSSDNKPFCDGTHRKINFQG